MDIFTVWGQKDENLAILGPHIMVISLLILFMLQTTVKLLLQINISIYSHNFTSIDEFLKCSRREAVNGDVSVCRLLILLILLLLVKHDHHIHSHEIDPSFLHCIYRRSQEIVRSQVMARHTHTSQANPSCIHFLRDGKAGIWQPSLSLCRCVETKCQQVTNCSKVAIP